MAFNLLDGFMGKDIERFSNKALLINAVEVDYEGIAKVLKEFTELYKVVENKDMLDKCFQDFISSHLSSRIYNISDSDD